MSPDITACFPQFGRLDPEGARMLETAQRTVTIPAGTVVFQDGSECANYVLVMDGSVRVQKVAENGREIVLYRVERGQSCVLTTNCLIAREDYAAQGIAETEVRALVLPAPSFRALLGRSEVFRDFVFSAYASRIADLLMLIEEVAFGRVDVRLAAWLRQHADGEGWIRATHQDIATELGTAREVVSRQLKEFERRGWVELHRGKLSVRDRAGLASLSDGM
ncbi:Crp/Fnr family transcriptional regulator [Magnetospirillum sp. UT-4]|uniref:Crp/Fnr family transcriptional regulator n=1 Tax=Magnetospirillum sp. UT-4 TaxID=2681467 RepID=UPI001384DD57|nr:Crp/Fnr family transcriptional regulator [Magnetospirillum sp. UT-4]CAA7615995.1 Cyclic nucleotide-binding:Bacterial regulatory protein, Crp [Magnetospirillum sp. UT-4]